MKKTNRKSGFTLVELMIVAAIIAILAAIIIPLMTKNKDTARAAEGKNLCGTVMTAAKTQWARTDIIPTGSYTALDDTVVKDEVAGVLASGYWTAVAIAGQASNITVTATSGKGTVILNNSQFTGTHPGI